MKINIKVPAKDYFANEIECPFCHKAINNTECVLVDWIKGINPILMVECCRTLTIEVIE